jgi:hypothetical protein
MKHKIMEWTEETDNSTITGYDFNALLSKWMELVGSG